MRLPCLTRVCAEFTKQSWYLCKAILDKTVNNSQEELEMSSLNRNKFQFEQRGNVDCQAAERVSMKETSSLNFAVVH